MYKPPTDAAPTDPAALEFYSNLNCTDTVFNDCTVTPANAHSDALSQARSMNGVTFDNLLSGASFCLGNGRKSTTSFTNIHITNAYGGSITVNNTNVNGMTISGNHVAELTLEKGASINGLTATAGIVKLNGKPGTSIRDASFTNTTFSMSGRAVEMTLANVRFDGTNVQGLNLSGAMLTNVNFTRCNMEGLNLNGATLGNVMIDGVYVTSPEQLRQLGVGIDNSTQFSLSPDAKFAETQRHMEAERGALLEASISNGNAAPPNNAMGIATSPFADLPGMESLKLTTPLAGGDDVTLNNVSLANVPKTEELAAKKAAEAPSRAYFENMSNVGGFNNLA